MSIITRVQNLNTQAEHTEIGSTTYQYHRNMRETFIGLANVG